MSINPVYPMGYVVINATPDVAGARVLYIRATSKKGFNFYYKTVNGGGHCHPATPRTPAGDTQLVTKTGEIFFQLRGEKRDTFHAPAVADYVNGQRYGVCMPV